tara:strand:- start:8353 stop:9534 length:1182 start_codon:yes stop_codon:yes gene_type:complete
MKLLIVSYYFTPDLSAGSFRTQALIDALLENKDIQIDLITTYPHRYKTFKPDVDLNKRNIRLNVHRIKNVDYGEGFFSQILAFISFSIKVLKVTKNNKWDMVFATSSRLMTAYLGSVISKKNTIPLYVDIRDLFVDTINDLFSKRIVWIVNPFLKNVEKKTFKRADTINLVSSGFNNYVSRFESSAKISNFTNGIDNIFLDFKPQEFNFINKKLQISYIGNIGGGQALEKIIPKAALKHAEYIEFKIVGDGNAKEALKQQIKKYNIKNVIIEEPIDRSSLLEIYMNSDVLFLHLDGVEAFKKVLPSKLFEYAATNKPIIAGVNGYAKEFIDKNIDNAYVFNPCDVEGFNKVIEKLRMSSFKIDRNQFCTKFSRSEIMKKMSIDILNTYYDKRK